MKKRNPARDLGILLATGLCSAASTAHAQSNVTLFGDVDLNVTWAKAAGRSNTGMDQGGHLIPSRIGFKGTQDLGQGWSAGFWLEAAILADSGAVSNAFFGRRSTLQLSNPHWGEIRLGRDYTAVFRNISQFSPFGTVGVGGISNIIDGWPNGFGAAKTLARASNSIGYFLPASLGGIYGQFNIAAGEGVDGAHYQGVRLGYAKGSLNIAGAYGQTRTAGSHYTTTTLGGSWDWRIAKAYANYVQQKLSAQKQANVQLGLSVPVGQSSLKASIARSHRSDLDSTAVQYALGYDLRMSKRTTLYAVYATIRNQGQAAFVTTSLTNRAAGQSAQGLQLGVHHAF